jgi:hypothetical protein
MAGWLVLWLVPEEPARARLEGLIAGLAERLGTPPFRPHVTLLGRMGLDEPEALARARELAARQPPVPLVLPRAGHDAGYFRCVFLEAKATPEVLGAHQRARRAMGGGPDRFRPHLSLVYGRIQEEARTEIAREVETALGAPLALTADRVEVHETRGEASRWRRCGGFGLTG